LTLQEGLNEAERIKVLMSRHDMTSQAYVFHNAVNIFNGNPDGIQEQIIPLILVKSSEKLSRKTLGRTMSSCN